MADVAIAYHQAREKANRYRLAVVGGCPVAYDITSADQAFGSGVTGTDGFDSFLYALGYAWGLYWHTADQMIRVIRSDGVTDTIYDLSASPVDPTSGKLISDGTSVWAAWSVVRTVTNPYAMDYTDHCADINCSSRFWNTYPTWEVEQLEIFHSSGGAFSSIGTVDAAFNNTSVTGVPGQFGSMVGRVEGCASAEQVGQAFFFWSEAGFTGTDVHPLITYCAGHNCGGVGECTDATYLKRSDPCRDFTYDPIRTLPGNGLSPDAFVDWNWFGERFVVATCDTSSITSEDEPIINMKSAGTLSYGDDFTTDSGIFSPTAIVPDGTIMAVNDDPSLVSLLTIWPTQVDYSLPGSETVTSGVEVTMRDVTTAVLQTLDTAGAVAAPGRTITALENGSFLSISRAAWADPADDADVYYVSSRWTQDVGAISNVHRVPTDGSSAFDFFDLDATVTDVNGTLQPGTVMPETWNTWAFRSGSTTGFRYERHCPQGWLGETVGHVPTAYEFFLVGDFIYYGGISGGVNVGARQLCLCRLCAPCPGEVLPILVQSPFIDGETYSGTADWTVRSCSPSITTVEFLVDSVVVCTATNPVGSTFYYCDSAPGTIDLDALGPGDHDLEWIGYDDCGEVVWDDAVTITVSGAATGVVFKVNGTQLADLDTARTAFRTLFIRAGSTDNDHWFGNIAIGTGGYGSSDIFSEDWSSASFGAGGWSSSDPDGLWTFSGGRLHAIGPKITAFSSAQKNIGSAHALPVYIRVALQVDATELTADNGLYLNFYAGSGVNEIGGIYLYLDNLGFYTDLDFLDCDISCPFALVDGDVITIDIGIFGP